MREIKFRFWSVENVMLDDHEGWSEGIGINYALHCSGEYGYKIMQYTGLKDKNGKDIFEGDVLSKDPFLKVVYENGGFCFANDLASGSDRISQDRVGRLEIIGNIYESPELLKP